MKTAIQISTKRRVLEWTERAGSRRNIILSANDRRCLEQSEVFGVFFKSFFEVKSKT